jgi:nitrate reductase NapE component
VFKLNNIRLKGDDSSTRIMYYAEAKTWLILLILIFLLLNVAIGAADGFLAYLRYDDLRKSVRAALGEIGAKRVQ